MPGRLGVAAAALLAFISLEILPRLAVGRLGTRGAGLAIPFLPVALGVLGVARGRARPDTPAGPATRETVLTGLAAGRSFSLDRNFPVPGLAPRVIRLKVWR